MYTDKICVLSVINHFFSFHQRLQVLADQPGGQLGAGGLQVNHVVHVLRLLGNEPGQIDDQNPILWPTWRTASLN